MPRRTLTSVNAKRLLEFLSERKEFLSPMLILTHDYPDPDALASSFAFYYLTKEHYDIYSRIAYGGIIGRTENREMVKILNIPAHKFKASDLKNYAHLTLIDTQPAFENNRFPKERRATIVIDQHQSVGEPAAELAIVDTECGATSVILAQALLSLRQEIPERVATALAYGILTDTLNLYRANKKETIATYLDILPFCNMRALARFQKPSRSRRFFAMVKEAIQNACVREKLIVSHLGFVENPDLVALVADFLLTYKGMRWSLCTGRYNERLHMSLRIANPNAMAARILRDVVNDPNEAGGHGNIAGGSFEVGRDAPDAIWRSSEDLLVERLVDRLGISGKSKFCFPFQKRSNHPRQVLP